jgi:acetate kinase
MTGDMRQLLEHQSSHTGAAEAVELFCYQLGKWFGALGAVLGGVDTIVFSGGIGENAAEIRARACARLGYLGVAIDASRNATNAPVISTASSPTTVRVIPTDEEIMIARAVGLALQSASRTPPDDA